MPNPLTPLSGFRRPHATFQDTVIIYSDFFKADGAGLPDPVGGAWSTDGAWSTTHNRAHGTAVGASGNVLAVVDTGHADGSCRVNCRTIAGGNPIGVTFRYTSPTNYIFGRLYDTGGGIYKVVDGVQTAVVTWGGTFADNSRFSVCFAGPALSAHVNGARVATASEIFNQTATKHGIFSYTGLHAKIKHFAFDTLTAPSGINAIRLTSPSHSQVYQRQPSGTIAITVAGNYSGSPSSIEAQYGSTGWQTIVASPSGGTFRGTLTLPATGGLYTVRVRFGNDHCAIDRSYAVGVGDVWLVAGQSNSCCRLANLQRYSHATIRCGMFRLDQAWDDLIDPTDSAQTAMGSWLPPLATRLTAAQGVPQAFVTTGVGGSSLVGYANWNRGNPGNLYTQAVNTVTASGVNAIAGVIWYQGETEANNPSTTYSAYWSALSALANNFQGDLPGSPKTIVTQLSYFYDPLAPGVTRTSLDAVRIAQSNGWTNQANILPGPVLYDFPDINQSNGGDGEHIKSDADAATEAARQFRLLDRFHYGGSGDGRGPRFASASHPDSTHVDVTFTFSSGLAFSLGANPTIGWAVASGSGPHAVTAVAVQSPGVLRLTLASALGPSPVVSFGSFNDAADTTIYDDGAIPMPIEPFVLQPVS